MTFFFFKTDQDCIVRVPLINRNVGHDKKLINDNFTLIRLFRNIFLPQGYPDSVSEDYIHYQFWDTVQAFCSTINGEPSNYHYLLFNLNRIIFVLRDFIHTCHFEGSWCW